MPIADQPVSGLTWVARDTLRANTWNPNHQAPTEMALLRLSILENGWTQPIVARGDGEIVDGYHRWRVAADPDVAALTDGLVPVCYLVAGRDDITTRMATIRHNRARGSHHVLRMADLVADLVEHGAEPADIATRLGMEDEEVRRLLDRGKMTVRGANPDGAFSPAWVSDKGRAG